MQMSASNAGLREGSQAQAYPSRRKGWTIVIRNIKDRENRSVPRPALKSIVEKIAKSIDELGLKAKIESG